MVMEVSIRAEICDLVGLYILKLIGDKYGNETLGLYRDDGLAAFENKSGPQSDKIRKDITNIFEELNLRITIQCNIKVVNFLDITLDLNSNTYIPYKKPNDQPIYINKASNHPPNIIKQLPISISERISKISSNRNIFEESAPYYNEALKNSGYSENIVYIESSQNNPTRNNRRRNVIWYNPPFSLNVETSIAKNFLQLIDKHFKEHKFSKIFNRNNIKVSYSCLPNLATTIKSHNINLQKNTTPEINKCNCRAKESCPLNGNCLTKSLVYSGKVNCTRDEDT